MLVETQKDESVEVASPFTPLRVASLAVMLVAGIVVGAVVGSASAVGAEATSAKPKEPNTSADIATADREALILCKVIFLIEI